MEKLAKEKVAAIIPALNEGASIQGVLRPIFDSNYFDEVIVVDGASTDNTVKVSEELGARVIRSAKREGKGAAMKMGIESTDADVVAFFDADLIGFAKEYIPLLVDPVLRKEVAMCTGVRGHWKGLPYIIASIDPLLAIGGERAIRRSVLDNIPERFVKNFAVETAMNYYCKVNHLPTLLVKMNGVRLISKEKKWGLVKGLSDRIREVWQLIKIRLLIVVSKKYFKISDTAV